MRRPLTALAFSQAAGIVLTYYLNVKTTHLCLLCMGACFVFAWLKKKVRRLRSEEARRGAALCFLCMAAFLLGCLRMEQSAAKKSAVLAESTDTEIVTVEGLVRTVSFRGSRWDLAVWTGKETVLVRLDAGEEDRQAVCDLAGRICRFQGPVRAPDGRRNFGCFDYALYLRGRGVLCLCEVSRYRAESGVVKSRFLHALAVSKGRFLDGIAPYMDRESFSLLAGLMFGEKGYLDEDVYESFQRNGIAHVLAVSGLHVGLVYALVQKLLAGRKNGKTTLISLAALSCYACLANFSISVMRAAFMIVLHLAAFHLRRRYDLVSAASLAVLVFLTVNPYQLFDSGFQLSYMAAYSLGVALPLLELKALELADRYKKGWIDDWGKIVLPCVAVQLGMTPLTLFHFLIFSPVSLVLNPFAVALAGLLLPAGLALFFIQGLSIPLLSAAAAGPAEAFAKLLLALDEAGRFLGGSYSMPAPPVGMLCLYYGLFFYLFSEGRAVLLRKGKVRLSAVLCIGMMLGSSLAPAACGIGCLLPWQRLHRDLVMADVGQGDCFHVSCGGFDALIDGGGSALKNVGEDTLRPYLLKNGVSGLELAVVTHPDQDHAKGIQELSQVMTIRTVIFPWVYRNDPFVTEGYRAENIVFAGRGDEILLGDAVFHVLAPYKDGRIGAHAEDTNDTCLAGILEVSGLKIFLTADMTDETEQWLLADGAGALDADFLKIAHHGSAYSSREDFIRAVSPAAAMISCGRNNSYGHPAERVTAMLEEMDVKIYRTDLMGAIGVTIQKDGSIRIESADGRIRETLPTMR
ncbi:MAG: DNA internalization-related competence protein ComEC/Rec2 [Firmicutes bacterium]|nr:DNA internalization-related competence protein ComEC/Rec2 [Bacillota bacterium]